MRRSLDDDRRDGESVGGKLSDKNVRSHAQKALKQVLQTRYEREGGRGEGGKEKEEKEKENGEECYFSSFLRAQQLKPEERVSDEALNKLAADIELKLFNLHNQVSLFC